MKIEHEGYQYARFGELIARRPVPQEGQPNEDWENLDPATLDVMTMASIIAAEQVREQNIRRPRRQPAIITRSARNIEIGERLGFTGSEEDVRFTSRSSTPSPADTLAQRLTDSDRLGTATRVPEAEFDKMAKDLGQDPEEMRARFRGEHTG